MKIIIVGGGLSGLTTWLYLRKTLPSPESHSIHVYESHNPHDELPTGAANPFPSMLGSLTDSAPVIGNIISITADSVRLIKQIDQKLYDLFKTRGYCNENYTFKTARGHTIGVVPVVDFQDPPEYTVCLPRYSFWKLLHEVVGENNIEYKRVIGVDLSGGKPRVTLANGESEDADLVVGADGARSVVRVALFGDDAEGKYATEFEGFAGVGSFLDEDIPESITKDKTMVFTFGPTGSFGYCSAAPVNQRVLSWWSNWGISDFPSSNVMNVEDVRRELRKRHGTWNDPVIQRIIDKMSTDRIYPVWTTPDLPFWGAKGALLVGDAAHTLRAMSGQGAGQALEDTVTLCQLLRHYLGRAEKGKMSVAEAVDATSKALFEIRSPRTAAIRDRARRMYLTKKPIRSVALEYLWYLFIYMCVRYRWVGYLVLGLMWKGDDWKAEDEVEKYLAEREKDGRLV
ncbi:unnamed protein product [Periconia digitata]|uniref:FAD-binding domain-containing protein n=1 Tax=Periconia digitata TaxID=1303443 RepID=A0A9W4XEU3_9PLEO|nr:unnamed protein product [Periconia digitata]